MRSEIRRSKQANVSRSRHLTSHLFDLHHPTSLSNLPSALVPPVIVSASLSLHTHHFALSCHFSTQTRSSTLFTTTLLQIHTPTSVSSQIDEPPARSASASHQPGKVEI